MKVSRSVVIAVAAGVALFIARSPNSLAATIRHNPIHPVSTPGAPFTLPVALDLHDGTVMKFGNTYYAYGTQYGCGFHWGVPNTPWCGFGVSQASSLSGPWSAVTRLFSPSDIDPWSHVSWTSECGHSGEGCFNPRMIQRSGWGYNDGVFILWFNSPADSGSGANAYNVMGCNGPMGPCGPSAGSPYGSYHKPSLWIADGNGDFGITVPPGGGQPVIFSAVAGTEINSEVLDGAGTNGTNVGYRNLAALHGPVEGPGAYLDAASRKWILTFADKGCGYCTGTGTGYAVGATLAGPYVQGGNGPNLGFGQSANARDLISASSCGGQPRTVTVLDGQPYQAIDLWLGTTNETGARMRYEPLTFLNPTSVPGDGQPWQPFVPFSCR